jgi:broad specificity phosphatase PhoE
MLTVLLTRHGHTDRSEPEQYLGQRIDVPLSEKGRMAAVELRGRLAGISFERVVSSPLKRAVETATLARPNDPIEMDDRLKEADYGEWEGHTHEELEARWGAARSMWEADPAGFAIPGGESGSDVARRVRSFIEALVEWEKGLAATEEDHRVLVVAHSTLNRVLLAVCLGVPLRDYRRRFRQDWANLTVLRFGSEYGSGALLLLANDLGHVRGHTGITWG